MVPLITGTGNLIVNSLLMADIEHMGTGDKTEGAVIQFNCPEALPAVYDFIKVEIVFDKDMHGLLVS